MKLMQGSRSRPLTDFWQPVQDTGRSFRAAGLPTHWNASARCSIADRMGCGHGDDVLIWQSHGSTEMATSKSRWQ